MLGALVPFLWRSWGWPGLTLAGLLCFFSARGLLKGVAGGEVRTMITTRRRRTTTWLLGMGGLAAVLAGVETEDRVGGSFRLRPARRVELRASVAGFLRVVHCDEGDKVSPGAPVARLDVPGLASRLAQKRAELDEARARLRLLEIGPRPEEVVEQRRRVDRAQQWRDLAQRDLQRSHQAFESGLDQLEKQIAARTAEMEVARDAYRRSQRLVGRGAVAQEQIFEDEGKYRVSQAPGGRRSWPKPEPSCGCWKRGAGRRRSRPSAPAWPAWRKSSSTWRSSGASKWSSVPSPAWSPRPA
jgi:multidrug efflux pump subunit AcrA (membrane-fusion protein)